MAARSVGMMAIMVFLLLAIPACAVVLDDGGAYAVSTNTGADYMVDYNLVTPPNPGTSLTVNTGGIVDSIVGGGNGLITLNGGVADTISLEETSTLHMCAGNIERALAFGDSSVVIKGGTLHYTGPDGYGELGVDDRAIVQFEGVAFSIDGSPVTYGTFHSTQASIWEAEPARLLTGTLIDGTNLSCEFRIGHDARMILIPEPAGVVLLLMGFGSLRFRKRRHLPV